MAELLKDSNAKEVKTENYISLKLIKETSINFALFFLKWLKFILIKHIFQIT